MWKNRKRKRKVALKYYYILASSVSLSSAALQPQKTENFEFVNKIKLHRKYKHFRYDPAAFEPVVLTPKLQNKLEIS